MSVILRAVMVGLTALGIIWALVLWPRVCVFMRDRLFFQAREQTKQGNWPQADALWRRYFRWGGEGAPARYYFAQTSRELADAAEDEAEKVRFLDESIAQLSLLRKRGIAVLPLLLNLGDTLLERSHFATGDERVAYWRRAEQSYNEALEADPAMAVAWGNRGTLLLVWGRYATGSERGGLWQQAEDCYRRALALDENAATVWAHLGRLAWMRADFTVGKNREELWTQAEKYYDHALRLAPDLIVAREERTNLLVERASRTIVPVSPVWH